MCLYFHASDPICPHPPDSLHSRLPQQQYVQHKPSTDTARSEANTYHRFQTPADIFPIIWDLFVFPPKVDLDNLKSGCVLFQLLDEGKFRPSASAEMLSQLLPQH